MTAEPSTVQVLCQTTPHARGNGFHHAPNAAASDMPTSAAHTAVAVEDIPRERTGVAADTRVAVMLHSHMATAARQKAQAWLATTPKRLLIGGQWVEAQSGKTIEVIAPSTEEVLSHVAKADSADIDLAVIAAPKAFEAPSWNGISPHQRTRWLLAIADAVERNAEDLAILEAMDMDAPLAACRPRVAQTAEVFRYYAGWPTRVHGSTNPMDSERFQYILREPMGVCALINAWNMPLVMATNKIASALAFGNTAILKPVEQGPLTTLRLAELIHEVGLPPGVLNVLPGYGPSAGAAMAAHIGIDKIAFTGSTPVGRQVLQASTGNMKRVTLELGGKSPNIISHDANLDNAIQFAVDTFCSNSGQICSAGTRLLVHESLHDEVTERVSRLAATYKVGSPFDADTKLGPLISWRQMDRVLSYIDSGTTSGAQVSLTGGCRSNVGYFVEPTVFSVVRNDMKIAREEIFDPVLSHGVQGRSRRDHAGERHRVRPGRRRLGTGRQPRPSHGPRAQIRPCVDQHLLRRRRGHVLRRLQAVRLRPRTGRRIAGSLHADQVCAVAPVRREPRESMGCAAPTAARAHTVFSADTCVCTKARATMSSAAHVSTGQHAASGIDLALKCRQRCRWQQSNPQRHQE